MSSKEDGIMIVLSSPSGAGKTTICKKLLTKKKSIQLSISYTTRTKRNKETHGEDYYFIKYEDFQKLKRKKYFIETAKVFDNFYGSPYENIQKAFKNNKHILFDIDWQGAKKLRNKFPKSQIIDFFILPPSKIELKRRLIKRGRDNEKEINKRLSLVISEIKHYKEYEYVLINDKIIKTVNNLKKIIDCHFLLDKFKYQIKNYKIY